MIARDRFTRLRQRLFRDTQKAYESEAVCEESFASVTNGCHRNYLIVIGHQVPLIDVFPVVYLVARDRTDDTEFCRRFIII